MFPSITQTWPQLMYHASLPHATAKNPLEKEALVRKGYSDKYVHRTHPVMMYHATLEPKKAETPAEQKAMEAEGWTTKHVLVKLPSHEMNADGKMVPVPDRHLPVPRAAASGAEPAAAVAAVSASNAIALQEENERLKKMLDELTQPAEVPKSEPLIMPKPGTPLAGSLGNAAAGAAMPPAAAKK